MTPLRKVGKVYYSDLRIDGERVRRPLSTDKAVANEKLRELEAEQEQAKYGPAINQITWSAFVAKYRQMSKGRPKSTHYRDMAAIHSLEKFKTIKRLSDITPEVLSMWKGARKEAGKGHATINRDMKAVKAMMKTAVAWGYLRAWDGSSVKKLKEAPGRLLWYTVPEVRRLLEVCRSRFSAFYDWETICLLGVRMGFRRGEIYWLSWDDVDFKRGQISIIPKDGWIPKDAEQRHVPMPKDLAEHLMRTKRRTRWVIGERPSLEVMSAFFRKISRKAKLAGNIHTLRHTYASWLVQAGVDLYTVAKLLGHSDPKQTQIYAHLAPVTLENAVKLLPAL